MKRSFSASLFGTSTGAGLFGAKPTTTAAPLATPSVNRGLGGLDVSVSNKGLSQGSNSPTAAKENLLPNELMQTINGFKLVHLYAFKMRRDRTNF